MYVKIKSTHFNQLEILEENYKTMP